MTEKNERLFPYDVPEDVDIDDDGIIEENPERHISDEDRAEAWEDAGEDYDRER